MRSVVLGSVLAAFLVACGSQTKVVKVATDASFSTAVPSTTTARSPVPGPIAARAERSVLPIFCFDPGAGDGFVGTGFRLLNGVVTASHVAAECPPRTRFSFGDRAGGTVLSDDPAHDLALATYESEGYPGENTDPNPKLLRPESKPAYVGQPLALIGFPGLPALGNPFERQATTVAGTVVATNRSQVLMSASGTSETLKDVIEVAAPGIVQGESGGPAIDSAGKVVGVIEGSSAGIATLTPVADLTSLR